MRRTSSRSSLRFRNRGRSIRSSLSSFQRCSYLPRAVSSSLRGGDRDEQPISSPAAKLKVFKVAKNLELLSNLGPHVTICRVYPQEERLSPVEIVEDEFAYIETSDHS